MSIEIVSLKVPKELRVDFWARATRLVRRAELGSASPVELELALGVLAVLCGAGQGTTTPLEPSSVP